MRLFGNHNTSNSSQIGRTFLKKNNLKKTVQVGEELVSFPEEKESVSLTEGVVKFIKTIRNETFGKSLSLIGEKIINDLNNKIIKSGSNVIFDEVAVFRMDTHNVESVGVPVSVYPSRKEEEGYRYRDEAQRLLSIFVKNYKQGSPLFNTPILIEDAYKTEFDIMIIMDNGYIILLNKKKGLVSKAELELVKDDIFDAINIYKIKINQYLDSKK